MNVPNPTSFTTELVLALALLPAALCCLYLLALTLLSGRARTPSPSTRQLRFDVVVPAHNEQATIGRTVRSLLALDWPRDCYRVLVVADNCTDATAAAARGAGAHVVERVDPERRAKGYALQYAFAISRTLGWAEAVVVVDADSEVSPHLLEAFAARLERGAPAVQARYGVLNPMDSWRTRLITVAKACFHDVRSRARERLALSCGIRGNGWCVPHRTLHRVPYRAFSLAEDVEYGLALGRAGLRVHYADEAAVLGEMVSGERAARSQRRRWEHGRAQLRAQVPSLLRRGTPVALDLALDLLLMPLAWVALSIVVTGAAAWWLHAEAALWAAAACGATLALHVARGAQLTGLGWDAATALLHVPGFVLWKLWVMVPGRAASAPWLRTERENAGRVARP